MNPMTTDQHQDLPSLRPAVAAAEKASKRRKHGGPSPVPALRVHSRKKLAYARVNGRMKYFGRAGTPESVAAYLRYMAIWLDSGRQPCRSLHTVGDLVRWARDRLAADRLLNLAHRIERAERRVQAFDEAVSPMLQLYASLPVGDFDALKVKMLRQEMIRRNWSRTTINHRLAMVQRTFRDAAISGCIDAQVASAVALVRPLRRGDGAREPKPIGPADPRSVLAVLTQLPPTLQRMVLVQMLTGMRSGELCTMRPLDIHADGDIWIYSVQRHKTDWQGHPRIVCLGPIVQAVLRPALVGLAETAFIFRPSSAVMERRVKDWSNVDVDTIDLTPVGIHATVRFPRTCVPGSPGDASGPTSGDCYDARSYARALRRTMARAPELLPAGTAWHPHRLRHLYATRLAAEHGMDVARTLLGHHSTAATERYVQPSLQLAREVVRRCG